MFTRLLKHIHHYYIAPRQGHPPWWVHLGVFATAWVLWFVVWQPIKVYHTEPMSFSEAKGDRIEIIEKTKTNFFQRNLSSSWMRIRFNHNSYWCNCYFDSCTYGRLRKGQVDTLYGSDILLINQNYCLVTSVTQLENNRGDLMTRHLRTEVIDERLKEIGGEYFVNKIFFCWFSYSFILTAFTCLIIKNGNQDSSES